MHTTHPSVVSSKEIQRVRRLAKRVRAAVACARCKSFKVKCNDYRPCKQCSDNSCVCEVGMVRNPTSDCFKVQGAVHIKSESNKAGQQSKVVMNEMVNLHAVQLEHSGQAQNPPAKHSEQDAQTFSTSHRLIPVGGTAHFESSPMIQNNNILDSSPYYNASAAARLNMHFLLPLFASSLPPMSTQIAALPHRSAPPPTLPALQPGILPILAALTPAAPQHQAAASPFLPRF